MPRGELPDTVIRKGAEVPFSFMFQSAQRVVGVTLAPGLELVKLARVDVAGNERDVWENEKLAEKAYMSTRFYPQQDALKLVVRNSSEEDLPSQGFYDTEEAPVVGDPAFQQAAAPQDHPYRAPAPAPTPQGFAGYGGYGSVPAQGSGYGTPAQPERETAQELEDEGDDGNGQAIAPIMTLEGPSPTQVAAARRVLADAERQKQAQEAAAFQRASQERAARVARQAPVQPVMGHTQSFPGPPQAVARARAAAARPGVNAGAHGVTSNGNGNMHGNAGRAFAVGGPGHNQVQVLLTVGQAQRLLSVTQGKYVSPLELVDCQAPLERALGIGAQHTPE